MSRVGSSAVSRALTPIGAAVLATMVGLVLVIAAGASLGDAAEAFRSGTIESSFAVGTSINRIAILSLVGGGFVIALRAGLVNVGGEGQIAVGGLAGTAVALHIADWFPSPIAVALSLAAGALAGAGWAAIAGVLKQRRGVNEVITTLLLNFVGVQLVSLAVQETWLLRQPITSANTLPVSPPIPEVTRLPLLGDAEFPMTGAIVVALCALLVTGAALRFGSIGLKLRSVGLNPLAARRAGIEPGPLAIKALATSGAFAGCAGALLVTSSPFVLKEGFTSGLGFDGLVIGLLAGGSIIAVGVAAIVFGFLASGGVTMQVLAGVPASVIDVTQALIVIAIAAGAFVTRRQRRLGST